MIDYRTIDGWIEEIESALDDADDGGCCHGTEAIADVRNALESVLVKMQNASTDLLRTEPGIVSLGPAPSIPLPGFPVK